MVIGVVANGVAILYHALDQLRILLQIVSDQKEGGGHLVGLQRVENLLGTAVLICGGKGEIEEFL